MTDASDEILFETADGAGLVTLNRPRAINALTWDMCDRLHEQLAAWASDDAVERVEIRGAGERGLCSGADVRAIRRLIVEGEPFLGFFDSEYAMNSLTAGYPKPYVAHMSGIVMGGGLGVSAHGSRRIVDATSCLAMPETIIGFTPDVGIAHYLGRAGALGLHVALTGESVGAGDALALGLADEYAGEGAPEAPLTRAAWIAECYVGDPVEIVGRLAQHADPDARSAAKTIRQRCPMSVAITWEAVRRAASMSVDAALAQDRRLAASMLVRPDFAEGVRAQLVDKDYAPSWRPGRLEDVTRDDVLALF